MIEIMNEHGTGMMTVTVNVIGRKTGMIESATVIDTGIVIAIAETVIVALEREIVVVVIEDEIGRGIVLDGPVHEKERGRGNFLSVSLLV